jgi:hypothetical protein
MPNQSPIVELDPLSEVGFSIIVCHKSNRFYPFHRKASKLIQTSIAADLSSRILSEKGMISQLQYIISPRVNISIYLNSSIIMGEKRISPRRSLLLPSPLRLALGGDRLKMPEKNGMEITKNIEIVPYRGVKMKGIS